MIEIRRVTKQYQTQSGKVTVLRNVNLSVQEGEMVAIMGRSGSGKSTLLNIIAGITSPTSGQVSVCGKILDYTKSGELCRLRRNLIGYIVQSYALIGNRTAWENVILPVRSREYRAHGYQKVRELLDELEMTDKVRRFPNQLSNGEKQRVAIARALVDNKKMILADEPTGAMDQKSAENTVNLLRRLAEEKGITILIVTHDMEVAKKCDRIVTLSYGEIV
ncbi:MAG: ABC transporter ATP-binding protein [Acetatifactor sp.]|nr:ABC transporter ATP-binding protein [Acetatifactor sp.]MBS7341075.1 ABC transporter ATP-binding protein [Lachnospiraceae bacterium]